MAISRRSFLKGAGIAAAGALAGVAGSAYMRAPGVLSSRNRDDRPNILWITSDTTRPDHLGFYGHDRGTPALDGLAEQGVIFNNHYSQAPSTFPSISSFLTSKYPYELGTLSFRSKLDSSHTNVAELLKQRGYNTFGVTSVFFLRDEQGMSQGFDFFSSPIDYSKGISGQYIGPIRSGEDSVSELIKAAGSKIGEEGPNFYWIHLYDPHVPYAAPQDFTFKYGREGDFDDKIKHVKGFLCGLDGSDHGDRSATGLMSDKEVIKFLDMYDGQIAYTDDQIGRLVRFMNRTGLLDFEKDLVVFNADHGELLGEYGCFATHHGGYEEVTHIPFLIAGAGFEKKKSLEGLTSNLDIVPTILDVIDSRSKDPLYSLNEFRGVNLVPLINGDVGKVNDFVVTDLPPAEGFALHTTDFTLIKRNRNLESDFDLASLDGFSPSGTHLDYNPKDMGRNIIRFSWPDLKDYANDSTRVRFSLEAFAGGNSFPFMEVTVPYSTHLDVDTVAFSGESHWNRQASMDKIIWKVQFIGSEDKGDKVLFDSGNLEFRVNPTSDFNQLYDLRKKVKGDKRFPIRSMDNEYDNPDYQKQLTQLSEALDDHKINVQLPEYLKLVDKPMDDSLKEQINNLGYI